ncbi:MAG: hypothetical protein K9I34_00415 [Bacteroidales bacterium]|nr:hypothetical protein [Bacteroidales bacterium]
MTYQYINLDYLYKHAAGNMTIVAEMLRLSILNVKMYRTELIEYFSNGSRYKLAESAYWAKQKLPLVGLVELSVKMNQLEKLAHTNGDVDEMRTLVQEFDTIAPIIIEELESELQHLILS